MAAMSPIAPMMAMVISPTALSSLTGPAELWPGFYQSFAYPSVNFQQIVKNKR